MKVRLTLKGLSLLVFMFALTSLANAQATRTWVSGVGDDVNPCSRTAPCKTFAGAISKTATNGEINALDPAGFGTLTITKSITVDGGPTGEAGVLASLVNGFVINDQNSGAPNTIQVILRHLSIDGAGNGLDGIRFVSGRRLTVEHCVVFGFSGDGFETAPAVGTNFNITIRNTSFIRNGTGIRQGTTIGTLNVSYENVNVSENTGDGMVVTGGTANINNSVIDSNGTNGINVSGGAVVNADDNKVTSNGTNGISSGAGSTVRLNNNTVHRNTTGLSNAGTMQSCSNNKVYGNTTDLTGAVTPVSPGSCTQ
ncbi:MAG TPA: right-handed parallel beta-helix repeat-containing protein [Pyrinomonadaceae bacterium]|jgi:hypothetical protein|nr:right-handed parallel beta-helix repeat-containing protein [Pyrinomonadaceae bacterium]